MKKRVLSMFMALALCLTLLPAPVRAAEDTPESGAIVQEEQEEATPAISEQAAENGIAVQDGRDSTVSEQAGTNEDENGAEGGRQNTDTPDAGGAEDSKADAPESGEDENAGNNADAAVSAVQTMIDALPIVSELDGMTADELDAAYDDIQAAYDAYEALNAEQQAQITGADFEALLGWFNSQTALLADAQSGEHIHCVCGKDSGTTVNGHTHNNSTAWTAADSLPGTAGSYYLTQSVSSDWTVPTGEVNLCLNGQTISGKITVGSGATLTLTDCTGTGKLQGSRSGSGVSINGGTFNLYGGTITGFVNGVEIGSHNDIKTGSSFTMYGGAITGNKADSSGGGGVFLIGTTNSVVTAPSFTMHGGTISNNTAGASDGGGGGVYVGVKCSFTMDGGTITGNTATAGNGGGIYIHFNAGKVSISGGTITGNKATATGNISCGHGGGIYSERGVTVGNVKITGNNSTFEGGGIYGKGAITLTDATVTDNNQYDVYYDGKESTTPELTVSGLVQAGYYANYDWKLPILVSGALNDDSVIRVGVRDGIKPNAGGSLLIAEPASGVTLRAENFKADAADCVTSLGDDGKVYLVPCTHEMDDTGYTCSKCGTTFDARVGESAYYQTLTKAFDAARGNTVTLLRDVTLTGNCSSDTYSATLDLNGKTVSSDRYYICVGGGNKPNTLTVKDSGTGGGTQALTVKFLVYSNGTLAVDNSYTGKISRVELQAGGALERFGGEIGELVLSNAAHGSTSTGYGLKLWKGNTNACTIGGFTDNTTSKSLTVNDLLGTAYAKCELYGEKDGTWSIVDKSTKIAELTGYTAYKVQFPECVHQCADDSNPVCSVCHKKLYTKITAKAADGTTKTAYFTEDSALENGYVEAIQTLNGWSNEGCTEPTLTLLRDMYAYGTSMPLTGTLTLKGGTHTAKNVTVAKNADVTFASGSYKGATIDGTATVKEGVTFTDASVEVNGTLNAKGGTFTGNVKFNGSSIANISGGSFNNEKKYGGVTFDYNVTGTITGGTFTFADFYTTKVKLSGGTFTIIKSNGDRKLADLLAEGAAYYGASDNQAVTNDGVNTLENVKVVSHTHNGGTDGKGICSVCKKQMAASLTVGGKTSWYAAFATAIEAANAADGEKTITLYQDVNGYADGYSTTYELTHGPVTLATGGKSVTRANLTAKGISLTVTGSNGGFNVTVEGKDAELTVNDKDTKLAIVTAQNGGKLSLSNGTFSRVAVKDDGSSASLSGGSYGEITSDAGYVKPYALLAKGYAYKKTRDNQWLPNANSIPSEVTVEKAPFAVEKIYPNSDTNYTGNSAFATDGNITLTAVIASEPETENVTYYYWWELFNESENDWTTRFKKVNTATHTGEKSKTLTISGLPVDKSYQYHIFVQCSNGYQCYSEPFTVTQHQHSWTYSASGATITAKCTAEGCYLTDGNGGSVTIKAPAELTYSGEGKPATVTASSDWQGPAASEITISYIKTGKYGPEILENGTLPTNAGEYTADITVGEGNKAATASVKYTIQKANPVVTEWPTLSASVYVNSEATLTGGSGEGTFAFKAGTDKSWDSTGNKTTTIVFIPTDTNNYKELTQDYNVTVVKRTVKSCNTLTGITDKPYGMALEELGLPETVTITTEDGKTFDKIPVTWSGYNPNTLEEQTLTGTLDLTSIANEVEQPGMPVTAQIKVKLTLTRSECDHKHTEIRNQREATCKEEGYTGDIYCKDCGEKLAAGTTIEKKPHKVGTPATCVSKAVCSVCSEIFGEVDATNHVHTTVKNRREATCTQTGYTGDTYCTDCDKLLRTGEELAALGHDYKATVTKQPTTTEEGVRTYTCTRCSSSYTESIAKLPEEQHTHNYTGSITKEATCTEAGVRTYTCSCGDSYTENIPATGHSYVSKVTKAATTTEEGIMTYTCSKCGHSYTQPIAKLESDDSSKDNGSQNQKPQPGTDNGNQNQEPQPDTDNGKDNGTSIKPYIKDDSGKKGWDVIKPQLEEAKPGDTVTVAMNGTTVVPKDVIDSIKGKDTTLVLDMGNGLSWKVYGKDITGAAGDIDFGVTVGADAGKSIPVDVINNVTGERYSINLTLAYDGELGFKATLTVNMESKNAGLYANLFYYNEQTGELEFICAGQIDSDGNVELVFTHASDYTIVVDTRVMSDNGQADNKADETIPAPKTDYITSKYAWNNTIIIIIGICIILIVFGAVFYVRKKSGSEEE